MNVAVGQAKAQGEDQGDEPKRRPWELTIPEVNDVIVGELAERGEWIVANIQTTSAWPVKSQKLMYRARRSSSSRSYVAISLPSR